MLTIAQKIEAFHAAEETMRRAFADLMDATTGETVTADAPVFDAATGNLFSVVGGKVTRKKITVIPKATS